MSNPLDTRDHYGKAMVEPLPDGDVLIIIDCVTCKRMTIGPMSPLHLRTMAELMHSTADILGMPDNGSSHIVDARVPLSSEHREDIRAQYEEMPLRSGKEVAKDNQDVWDKEN